VSRFANVLLDLDGTLTDPFEGIAASIRHAMRCMGLGSPSEKDLKGAIGPPLRKGFSKFLATQDASRIENAMRFYRERYSVSGLFENRVYPGVPQMLTQLNAAGCRLFVATSKPAVFAQRVIQHFDMEQYFVRVYGSELDGRLDNKVALLALVLDREALDPRKTAMVGDRAQDALAAKAHNLCAVGITWGYGSQNELQEAGADVLCNTPSEVVRSLIESKFAEL
jgi:phosphoglycolate phosphatase